MEKINLNNETKDLLLNQLFEYRYEKENNINALKELKRVIEQLNSTFSDQGNTLAYQNSRIKEENSFLNKIYKKINEGKNITFDDMHDIVGLRLVCLSLSDVYEFVNLLQKSELINVLEEKDYINNPKESGYMSYHIIVEVPIQTQTGIKNIKCEIQLRTIFMDIFAREEHKLSYKGYSTEEDKKTLKTLSEKLFFYDCALDNLFKTSSITKQDNGVWLLTGREVETLFLMTRFNEDESVQRFGRKLKGMGVDKELERLGAKRGDDVQIFDYVFEWKD